MNNNANLVNKYFLYSTGEVRIFQKTSPSRLRSGNTNRRDKEAIKKELNKNIVKKTIV